MTKCQEISFKGTSHYTSKAIQEQLCQNVTVATLWANIHLRMDVCPQSLGKKLKLQIAIPGSGSMSYTCNRGKSSEPDKVGYRSDKAFICAASKKILSFIYERPMSNLANYSNK